MTEPKAPSWEELLSLWEDTGQLPTVEPIETPVVIIPEELEQPTPQLPPAPEKLTEEELKELYDQWKETFDSFQSAFEWLSLAPLAGSKWLDFIQMFKNISWPSFPEGLIEKDEDVPDWRNEVYGKQHSTYKK